MQFSRVTLLAALTFIGFATASPVDSRGAMRCQIKVATEQSTCIDNAPIGADGQADMTALTECFTAASTGYNSCPNAEKRGITACQTQVQSVQTECIKAIPTRSDGTMDPASIMICSSAAAQGFNGCISADSTEKRDIFACADEVTQRQLDCLTNAGTDQSKVGKCSSDAYNGFVACV